MKCRVEDFNIEQIAESGQWFRWNNLGDMNYIGIVGDDVCKIKKQGNEVTVEGIDEEKFINYFDIKRNYKKIKNFYSNDIILEDAIKYGEGIRILNQDKFEVLISFIISAITIYLG